MDLKSERAFVHKTCAKFPSENYHLELGKLQMVVSEDMMTNAVVNISHWQRKTYFNVLWSRDSECYWKKWTRALVTTIHTSFTLSLIEVGHLSQLINRSSTLIAHTPATHLLKKPQRPWNDQLTFTNMIRHEVGGKRITNRPIIAVIYQQSTSMFFFVLFFLNHVIYFEDNTGKSR